jgi:hypothetical protein
MNSIQQRHGALHMSEGNVQRSRNPLRLHPLANRFHDHFVFLNRCQPADARIIGVTSSSLAMMQSASVSPSSSECKRRRCPSDQQILSRCALLRMHHQRFNHSNLLNGPHNRLIRRSCSFCGSDLPHRQYIRQRQPDFLHFKTNFFAHAASLYFLPNLAHRYFGIVETIPPATGHEILIRQQLVECTHDKNQPCIADPGLFYYLTLLRWLSRLYAFTRLSALVRALFAGGSVLRSFPRNRRCSIKRFTVRMETDSILLAFVSLQQFPLHLHVSALAMSIATPSGIRSADRHFQQSFFARLVQRD